MSLIFYSFASIFCYSSLISFSLTVRCNNMLRLFITLWNCSSMCYSFSLSSFFSINGVIGSSEWGGGVLGRGGECICLMAYRFLRRRGLSRSMSYAKSSLSLGSLLRMRESSSVSSFEYRCCTMPSLWVSYASFSLRECVSGW